MSKPSIQPNSTASLPKLANDEDLPVEAYRKLVEFVRIGKAGVKAAIENNRRLGIPSVYFINGYTYYELPDRSLTREDPYPALIAAKLARDAQAAEAPPYPRNS